MPSNSQRSTSTAMASIDFCQRASSGLPRLIRYEVWATGSTIPVSSRAESKGRDVLGRQGRGVPLVVVLGEELDGLELDGLGRPDRAVASARDRHVSTELPGDGLCASLRPRVASAASRCTHPIVGDDHQHVCHRGDPSLADGADSILQ